MHPSNFFPMITLYVVLLAFAACRGAVAEKLGLQQQVLALQTGQGRSLVSDPSGLLYPPFEDSVAWLRDYYKTGARNSDVSQPPATDNASTDGYWVPSGSSRASVQPRQPPVLVCGRPAAAAGQPRRNLLIVPAGDSWQPDKWLSRPEESTFDIVALYHGDTGKFSCVQCIAVIPIKGPKWRLYFDLASSPQWDGLSERYDFVMLPDDDLEMDTCAINTVFSLMRAYDLLLAQPAVCEAPGSATWRPELHQRPQYILRYSTFVEVMAPTFRMDFFDKVVRRTFSRYWTYVGWGLDSIWPALLHYPRDRIAVVDAVCMTHVPSAGGLGSGTKLHSVYAPGLSPYTAKQEELIVFSAYNYSQSTTDALGEEFMTVRVIGGVPNEEVLKAMAATTGGGRPESSLTTAEEKRNKKGVQNGDAGDSNTAILVLQEESSSAAPEPRWGLLSLAGLVVGVAAVGQLGWAKRGRRWRGSGGSCCGLAKASVSPPGVARKTAGHVNV